VQGARVGFFQAEDGVAHRLLESSHIGGVLKLALGKPPPRPLSLCGYKLHKQVVASGCNVAETFQAWFS
jgi:hypothetical protein